MKIKTRKELGSILKRRIQNLIDVKLLKSEKRSSSVIYYCNLEFEEETVEAVAKEMLKTALHSKTNALVDEYLALTTLYEEFENKTLLGVPRVLYFFKDDNLLVTERIREPSLKEVLFNAGRKGDDEATRNDLRLCFDLAATWLREFHKLTHSNSIGFPESEYLSAYKEALSESKSLGLRKELIEELGDVGSLVANRLAGVSVDVAMKHGDYQANNVLLSKNKVFGLDIQGSKNDIVLKDLSDMMVYLVVWNIKHRLTIDKEVIKICLHQFLETYYSDQPAVSDDVLNFVVLLGILQDMNKLLKRKWWLRPLLLQRYEKLIIRRQKCFGQGVFIEGS